MPLIIDGYNLLHASGILGRGVGPGSLERSRTALLSFLAESLAERELSATTVVFDAREAPPGLPRVTQFRGITVRFAERGSDADQEIEQLIAAHSSPRRLTVVSSDHRLHRAARRRRATAVDSDRWYAATLRERIERARTKGPGRKPSEPPTEAEVRFWLREFGLVDDEPAPGDQPEMPRSPFPPGYAEDISEEDV
jgi:predicted RNA-binding protein with PIN domain